LERHKYQDAEPPARAALSAREKTAADSWRRFESESLLGAILAGQRKYAEAEPLLLSGFEGMRQRQRRIPAPERFALASAGAWIVRLYEDSTRPDKASDWTRRLHADGLASISR
jgi:eukaryotic-like serine/threonine-protein kinase